MVAIPAPGEPTGAIEKLVIWAAGRAKAKASRTGRPPGNGAILWWLAELWGITAAFTVFTLGAFLYLPPVIGYAVLGVSLLVLDTTISIARRKRRTAARAAAETLPKPPPVRYQ